MVRRDFASAMSVCRNSAFSWAQFALAKLSLTIGRSITQADIQTTGAFHPGVIQWHSTSMTRHLIQGHGSRTGSFHGNHVTMLAFGRQLGAGGAQVRREQAIYR